jgi:CRP/FNR family cyclic AMP-dependent transcriptional regulator
MHSDLAKVSLFADFTEPELSAIEAIARKATLAKGEYFFREDDPGDSLVILNLGSLRLTKKTPGGEEQEIVILGSGSYLGEMSLFDQGRRSTSGQALERCEITVIPFSSLRNLLDKNDALAAKFYRRVAAGIAQRLKYLNEDFAALKKFLSRKD